jgi:hypothetical protein
MHQLKFWVDWASLRASDFYRRRLNSDRGSFELTRVQAVTFCWLIVLFLHGFAILLRRQMTLIDFIWIKSETADNRNAGSPQHRVVWKSCFTMGRESLNNTRWSFSLTICNDQHQTIDCFNDDLLSIRISTTCKWNTDVSKEREKLVANSLQDLLLELTRGHPLMER